MSPFHALRVVTKSGKISVSIASALLIVAAFFWACQPDEEPNCVYVPTLSTSAVADVTETTAVLNGSISISSENCEAPQNSEQGFVYSTAPQPEIDDNKVLLEGSSLNTTIDNLEPGKQYYVRTFLSNSYGEFYGNEVSLQTKVVNTCPEKYRLGGRCFESYFAGLEVDDADIPQYLTNIDRFEELLASNLYENRNPMWTIKQNGEWVIYYHIENWEGPVTATAISNLRTQYETITNHWLEDLSTFDEEAPQTASIKIFGFVFNEGVELDQSFYDSYGDYPIVTNWQDTDESAPWQVVYRSNDVEYDQNWYRITDYDLLKVAGNRKDLSAKVELSPADWSSYEHPEGVDMFFTKFWHKTTWDAVAQRQYLKLGGVISDYANGKAGTVTLDRTFVHEMGHCFFHDDIYDPVKYPDGEGLESVMNLSPEITAFDRILQRVIWEAQTGQ